LGASLILKYETGQLDAAEKKLIEKKLGKRFFADTAQRTTEHDAITRNIAYTLASFIAAVVSPIDRPKMVQQARKSVTSLLQHVGMRGVVTDNSVTLGGLESSHA
jgi:hypothetical protein